MNPKSSKHKQLVASLVVSLGAAVAFASSADAQTPKAPAPAPAPAAAPTPAAPPAPPVTPEQRAAARELLDVTHTREGLQSALQQMSTALRPQMGQMMAQRIEVNTTMTPEQKQKVRQSMQQPFDAAVAEGTKMVTDPKLVDDVVDRMVVIFARTFTLDEMKQLNVFYKSPLGQKTITGIPAAGRDAMQGMMGNLAPRLDALAESTVQKQVDAVVKGDAPTKAAPATKK